MNLPTIEPLPDENENENLKPARRRRRQRMIMPPDSGDRAEFLHELAYRTEPSFDFFLFSLLAGLTLGAALLLDSPGMLVLAALLAPFMAPVVGVSLGTITGTPRFVMQSLGSLSIGSLIVFLCGSLAGWIVNLLPARVYQQAVFHSHFTWPDFLVLVIGVALTSYLLVRSPNQKPLVTSAAIAYSLYLPVGVAGFGMTSGVHGLWPDGLGLFLINLIWAVLIGALVLGILGLRPLKASGYIMGAVCGIIGVGLLVIFYTPFTTAPFALAPVLTATPSPSPVTAGISAQQSQTPYPTASPNLPTDTPSPSPTITPTRTLVPTWTPTLTFTPEPTPAWARISAQGSDGALMREKPGYTETVVQSLLNATLVQVLPDLQTADGATWVHIRLTNGKEGWVVRTLLRTATPAPN